MSLETLQNYRNSSGKRLYETGHIVGNNEELTLFLVKSESNNDDIYQVDLIHDKSFCSCPDYEKRSKNLKCKHEMAVQYFIEANN